MASIEAFIAANRFGLGARPGELDAIAADPRGWAKDQTRSSSHTPALLRGYSDTASRMARIMAARAPGSNAGAVELSLQIGREETRPELIDRFTIRATTREGFRERMVAFWSNHFTVQRNKAYLPAILTAYEREAIRPHVFGRFSDLLLAAATHPAMLIYLDNVSSVGPNSLAGRRANRAINENLAREICELHTLGVNGGYTQDDVENFARALTGWGFAGMLPEQAAARVRSAGMGERPAAPGSFATFFPVLHEPGAKTVLGKRYVEDGPGEVVAILNDLAVHPSTARFIATKLVRHVVADDPPTDAVDAIAAAFMESGGDLGAVSRALVDLNAVWAEPLPKAKTPQEFVVAGLRALGADEARMDLLYAPLEQMGQPPFGAPSPQGWPDTADAWIAPEALIRRVEWAKGVATLVGDRRRPDQVLEASIGPVASDALRSVVDGAPSGEDALAFILASREFQRR